MAGGPVPGGQTAPPNINSMAAQGIQGAGMGTVAGGLYNPMSTSASTINPSNVNTMGLSPTVQAGQLSNTSLSPYMNPYTQQVIDANQADILRGANIGLGGLGAQANAANAFGGSRHGIAMSEMGRGVTEQLAQSSAGLRQAGYQNAQQAAMQDIQNNMQSQLANQAAGQFDVGTDLQAQLANQGNAMQAGLANQSTGLQSQLANQSAGLQANQQRIGAANQLGQLSNLGFNMGQTVNNNLAMQGAQQQAMQQALMDAAQQQYYGYTNQPAASLGYVNSALGVTPSGSTSTQTTSKKPGLFDYLTLGAMMQ